MFRKAEREQETNQHLRQLQNDCCFFCYYQALATKLNGGNLHPHRVFRCPHSEKTDSFSEFSFVQNLRNESKIVERKYISSNRKLWLNIIAIKTL